MERRDVQEPLGFIGRQGPPEFSLPIVRQLFESREVIFEDKPLALHPVQERAHAALKVVEGLRCQRRRIPPAGERLGGNVARVGPAAARKQLWQAERVFIEGAGSQSLAFAGREELSQMLGKPHLGGISRGLRYAHAVRFLLQVADELVQLLLCNALVGHVQRIGANFRPVGQPDAGRPEARFFPAA